MRIKNWIAGLHYQQEKMLSPGLLLLLPLEWAYGFGVSLRLLAYRMGWMKTVHADVPVISIGNLTTGGTGKTPMVVEITRGLIKAGKTVVVLSRGYGAETPVNYARALDPCHGDEAFMIQEQVPEAVVIVGRDRVQTLRRALHDYRPDYVLLDDGFQYLRLKRAMNILLIDGSHLMGNGHLLPIGPMREPLSELKRADLVFLTKKISQEAMNTVEGWIRQYGGGKASLQVVPIEFKPMGLRPLTDFKTMAQHVVDFELLRARPVIAFSAVAQPEQFEQDLKMQGMTLLKHYSFPDHHVYTPQDVNDIVDLFKHHEGDKPIMVTTDKDLPKVRKLLPAEIEASVYTLQMLPQLDGRWFYDEFLTQMPGVRHMGSHVHSH
jgi:tetraacyldisaccharide 4'-kinase